MDINLELKPGTLLRNGSYRIIEVLGRGGFGITYLAEHIMLGIKVAIKEFFPKEFCDRDSETTYTVTLGTQGNRELVGRLRAKFIKEARNIARLNHPYIIHIQDIFEENNTAYYVMDYIEGSSLQSICKQRKSIPQKDAVDYVTKIAGALEYIHSQSMTHLDVKPANIMIRKSDNAPVLIDFGLSKQYTSEGEQTSTTPVGISHGYAPIEQYRQGGVSEFSPATDIYALGATLYKLITGITPPEAPLLLDSGLHRPDGIDENVWRAISKAMSVSKSGRYSSASDFAAALNSTSVTDDDDEDTVIIDEKPEEPEKPKPVKPEKPSLVIGVPEKEHKTNKSLQIIIIAIIAFIVIAIIVSLSGGDGASSDDREYWDSAVVEEVVPVDDYYLYDDSIVEIVDSCAW